MHPHMLRHTLVTPVLDAGIGLRDVQIPARNADPRTTMRYDRAPQEPRPAPQLHPRRLYPVGAQAASCRAEESTRVACFLPRRDMSSSAAATAGAVDGLLPIRPGCWAWS